MTVKEWMKADEDKKREGGYEEFLKKSTEESDPVRVLKALEDIIGRSYGIKSADGRRFIKDAEETDAFLDSLAYDAFLERLMYEEGEVPRFVKSLIPDVAATKVSELKQGG